MKRWPQELFEMLQQHECRGCRRRLGQEELDGGIILLGSHWMVNHYQDTQERFLGWLVMQPTKHRMTSSEMTKEELEEFGVVAERLEDALKRSYDAMSPDDRVEIVYMVRLGESTLATPADWHLHCHLLARTASMKQKCEGWDIQKCRERGVKPPPSRLEIEELMTRIRGELKNLNSAHSRHKVF